MPVDFDITRFHGACIHQALFVTNWEAHKALRDIKTKRAAGPDGIHSVFLKLFDFELAPVITNLYNSMLREGRGVARGAGSWSPPPHPLGRPFFEQTTNNIQVTKTQ